MSCLRIGLICHAGMGGSGVIAAEVALGLRRRGHALHVVASQTPFRLQPSQEGVTVHTVLAPSYPAFEQVPHTLALASKIVKVIEKHDLDILHVHYAVPYAIAAHLARQAVARAIPMVLTLHGTDVTQLAVDSAYAPMAKLAVEKATALTAPSHYLACLAQAVFAMKPESAIHMVPNFVDEQRFSPAPNKAHRDHFVIAHSSNFRPIKRVHDVLEAFARVRRVLPAKLHLLGDGPDRFAVQAQVKALGLSADVHFDGAKHDVVSALRQADAFLLPSELESFGLSALEAMACGIPVIASNTGGLMELIEHGKSGFLAPVGDVDSMAEYLLRLARDANRAQTMGAAARARALHFTPDAALGRYETIYHEVLATQQRAG